MTGKQLESLDIIGAAARRECAELRYEDEPGAAECGGPLVWVTLHYGVTQDWETHQLYIRPNGSTVVL